MERDRCVELGPLATPQVLIPRITEWSNDLGLAPESAREWTFPNFHEDHRMRGHGWRRKSIGGGLDRLDEARAGANAWC
jgi:hypothetical protein